MVYSLKSLLGVCAASEFSKRPYESNFTYTTLSYHLNTSTFKYIVGGYGCKLQPQEAVDNGVLEEVLVLGALIE